MARVRGKHAVETHEMGSRSWYQRGQAGDEVQWLEQNMGGAVTERVLEFVDHQPVPVAAQTLTRNGGARLRVHLAAGGTASSSVAVSLGNPDNPMSWGDLRDKFTPLVEPVLADGSAARFDALRGFDLAGTLARVVALAA